MIVNPTDDKMGGDRTRKWEQKTNVMIRIQGVHAELENVPCTDEIHDLIDLTLLELTLHNKNGLKVKVRAVLKWDTPLLFHTLHRSSAHVWMPMCTGGNKGVWDYLQTSHLFFTAVLFRMCTGSRLPVVLRASAAHANARGRPFPSVWNQNNNNSVLKILFETYTEAVSKGGNVMGVWPEVVGLADAPKEKKKSEGVVRDIKMKIHSPPHHIC